MAHIENARTRDARKSWNRGSLRCRVIRVIAVADLIA